MISNEGTKRMPRVAAIVGILAVGAITATCLRGNAVQDANTMPPLQPAQQVLDLQNAFVQVADHLQGSVVYIRSRQTVQTTGMQDDGGPPFDFNFPGMPGGPGGSGRQFRMMPQQRHAYASGSGVIVRSDGYILTNDHVVSGADKVTVRLQDGREFTGKVTQDFRSDLAVVKIDATGLPAASLADSDQVKVGQYAVAFGSPFGLNGTMTQGIVSSLHREQTIGNGSDARLYPSLIQTDASINPGNSGGPLVDIYGRIIGINVAIESPSGGNVGIGFAIPSNTARYVMDQLISNGSVTRGFLGLAPRTLTFDEQERYGVKNGVLVTSVQDGTPASKAGFQVEDVITKFNGKSVADDAAFRDMVARTKPNTSVPVTVRRGKSDMDLNVTVGSAPVAKVAGGGPSDPGTSKSKLGVTVANAKDPEVRRQLNLKGTPVDGAAVVEVLPGSPAADAGIQPGDVIVRLNGKALAGAADLTAAAGALKSGSTVTAVIRRGDQTVLAQISLE